MSFFLIKTIGHISQVHILGLPLSENLGVKIDRVNAKRHEENTITNEL